MHKNHGLKITIVHKYHKKRCDGQGGGNQISDERDPFELVGVYPNAKNIGRKE